MIFISPKFKNVLLFTVFSLVMIGGLRGVLAATKSAPATKSVSSISLPAVEPSYTLGSLPDSTVYNDFVVGPGKIQLEMNPGESRTVEVTIANRLGSDKSFNVTEEDFTGSSDLNQPVVLLGDDRGPYSLKDFIHIPLSPVIIPHAEKAFIPVTISIPADAQPGGLYGSVIVSVATKQDSVNAPSGYTTATNPIITRLATLFFVRVAGAAKEEGRLTKFTLAGGRSFFFDNQPINFDLIYQNTGDVFLVPNGTITLSNILGSSMGSIAIQPWYAMPKSLRFREVTWTPPFLFGRYTAHASVRRGYGSTTDEMDLNFWVIPWKIILAIFVGLVIIIFIVRWIAAHVRIVSKRSRK